MARYFVILFLIIILSYSSAFLYSTRIVSSHRLGVVNMERSRRTRNSNLQMNMMDRFFRVVKSNINSVLQNLEDPEKVLDQAVNDMQADLIKIRQSYAEVSATQKRMEKQKEQAENNANEWYRRAQLALQKGDEELAKEALTRRQAQLDIANGIMPALNNQATALEKLFNSMQALEAKISEAKREKDLMIARARTAKTSIQVNDMLSTITGSTNSVAAFDRMKEKVETLESQSEAAALLATTSMGSSVALEEKFKALDSNSKVNEELEMLKRQLPGKQRDVKQLPPVSFTDVDDLEYERMKRELGKR